MRVGVGLIVCILLFSQLTQADDQLAVEPLFEKRALVPGEMLPLRLTGSLVTEGNFRGADFETKNGSECRIMRDPFRSEIFILKCTAEDDVTVTFNFEKDKTVYRRAYGPLQILKPDPDFVVGTPVDPDIAAGRALYETNCLSCHTSARDKANRSSSQISNAIRSNSCMNGTDSSPSSCMSFAPRLKDLTTDEIAKISKYLRNLP